MSILTEDDVIDAVIRFLEDKGWKIRSHATAKQRGYDVVAEHGAEKLLVEAKGAGSSRDGSPRHGHEFDKSQVNDHVAKAILKALRVVSGRKGRAAVAFPDNRNHREEVEQVRDVLTTLGIATFWISADGAVLVDGWKIQQER